MATTLGGVSLSSSRGIVAKADSPNKTQKMVISPCFVSLNQYPLRMNMNMKQRNLGGRGVDRMLVRAAPEKISEKVVESIKSAEETCADDPTSGECAAAWDEVEEVSAAASHARQKQKDSDPLETYCKDNPETVECRTYED
ncbi:calvin cycle protein CP12-1, chloroplastic-like [Macadamia integrifolia]|uniref:calvin cycle protein CP12-1, chloroplastic-like n=1 Tax=Macadamia integrifolia TaxID=60698 RepID=UPI001C4E7871|nr:calvin cycle protein CP12-1, chloroplastic-like [Macadamia integrifolia]